MGRYYWDKKDTVEDCRSVSISFLKKHDYLCGFRVGKIFWRNCYNEETGSIGIGNVMILGDSAGFVNMHKIKRLHNAIDSGMRAAKRP